MRRFGIARAGQGDDFVGHTAVCPYHMRLLENGMIKFLFFDNRDIETLDGFQRQINLPKKYEGNPFLYADLPAEVNLMSFYGSVIRRNDGLWQTWYKCYNPNAKGPALGYGESRDGKKWDRPALDVVKFNDKPTNVVFDLSPHGTAVIYDARETRPGWRYKMVHGTKPTERVSGHRSPDGIHWSPAGDNPLLGITSGGPLGLMRADDGRYVMFVRPTANDRRVARSESWDFIHWTEPRIIVDQDPSDPPQVQFYGMNGWGYGAYEMGLVWIYETVASDMGFSKKQGRMVQFLSYARSGWAQHYVSRDILIPCGPEGSWEAGQIHTASQPVFLEDEVRFYYTGAKFPHEVNTRGNPEPLWAMGYASVKPDRFLSLAAAGEAKMLTRPFWTETPEFYANAEIGKGGFVRAEITDINGKGIAGFTLQEAQPVSGDSLLHRLQWKGGADASQLANKEIRFNITAKNAKIYALSSGTAAEAKEYWKFRIPHALPMAAEKALG
jgi:hypothetical protein